MVIALFRPPRPTRQKNEEDQLPSSFFCLTFFCLVAERMIKARRSLFIDSAKFFIRNEAAGVHETSFNLIDLEESTVWIL